MNAKMSLCVIGLFLVLGCEDNQEQYLVFEYADFGPHAMAWETIGGQWWQWDPHVQNKPMHEAAIKVIVYHDTSVKRIKDRFPVDESRLMDFRYLGSKEAIRYLTKNIEALDKEDHAWAAGTKEHLTRTRDQIKQQFGLAD
jgi:hypothetical protein